MTLAAQAMGESHSDQTLHDTWLWGTGHRGLFMSPLPTSTSSMNGYRQSEGLEGRKIVKWRPLVVRIDEKHQ